MDSTAPARSKLEELTNAILKELTSRQCSSILSDIDTDDLVHLWVKHGELNPKQILKVVLQRRIGVVSA